MRTHQDDLLQRFQVYGGKHCETTALNHVLRHFGIELSEEMLLGLGGGIGFIYWYMKQMPTPLVGGRAGGREFNLIDNAVRRIGGSTEILTTSSARKAWEWVASDLAQGLPVICYGDMAYLPYFGVSEEDHFGGHVFVVYGLDEAEDRVWIADRGRFPYHVTTADLERSRGSTHQPFPPRNMTIRVQAPETVCDLSVGIREAIRGCVGGLENAPISNLGVRGISKWASEVVRWPTQFEQSRLIDCLVSTYLYIEIGGTGGSAFRHMYATFLEEAAGATQSDGLREAADAYRVCAQRWREIALAALPDRFPALGAIRATLEACNRAMEDNASDAAGQTRVLASDLVRRTTAASSEVDASAVGAILGELSALIRSLQDLEKDALAVLSRALS